MTTHLSYLKQNSSTIQLEILLKFELWWFKLNKNLSYTNIILIVKLSKLKQRNYFKTSFEGISFGNSSNKTNTNGYNKGFESKLLVIL